MRIPGLLLIGAVVATAGCDAVRGRDDLAVFDGVYYRAAVRSEREARKDFTVEVRDAAQGIAGAKEAGRFEAIKYCIKHTASSEIEWTVGPDTDDAALRLTDGSLVLQGTCVDPR